MFGVNNDNLGAGIVQFLLDLFEIAATTSSSSIMTVCWSGNTLPILLRLPLSRQGGHSGAVLSSTGGTLTLVPSVKFRGGSRAKTLFSEP